MKRALIIHGWTENPHQHWYEEEKDLLEKAGIEVILPLMPRRFTPNEKTWVDFISSFTPDEETILIGHSLGATAILEYLEKSGNKVGRVVLVGGPIRYSEKLNLENAYSFKLYAQSVSIDCLLDLCGFEEIYDWGKISQSANSFHLIYKKDDARVPLDDGIVLAGRLGAEMDILEGRDHCDKLDLSIINEGIL